MLTARPPDPALTGFCHRHGLVLVRISSAPGTRSQGRPGAHEDGGWIDARLASDGQHGGLRALTASPGLAVIVRPDRVIAAAGTRYRPPRLPWHVPAAAAHEHAAATHPAANTGPAGPLPTAS